MTQRLYYDDPALLTFEAVIVSSVKQGDGWQTILDRSAFYPTSGGQMHDTGLLNGVLVTDVRETDNDEVVHVTAAPVGEPGGDVSGAVDPARRRKHRQTHTAQHILSAVFFRLYDLNTVSVHLGDEYCSVELAGKSLAPEQLVEAERQANDIVLAGADIEIIFADSQEVEQLPLRRAPARSGRLRIIKTGDVDLSACGGTHCKSTAEVGVIKITGTEKMHGRVSVRFLAGVQALADYQSRFEVTDRLSRLLTCHVTDIPDSVARLQDEIKLLKRKLAEARRSMLPGLAAEMAEPVDSTTERKIVVTEVPDLEWSLTGQLGRLLADRIDGITVLLTEGRLFLAVGEKTGLHAGRIAKVMGAELRLKGGGGEQQAQLGGAVAEDLPKYRKTLDEVLKRV